MSGPLMATCGIPDGYEPVPSTVLRVATRLFWRRVAENADRVWNRTLVLPQRGSCSYATMKLS